MIVDREPKKPLPSGTGCFFGFFGIFGSFFGSALPKVASLPKALPEMPIPKELKDWVLFLHSKNNNKKPVRREKTNPFRGKEKSKQEAWE